MPEYIEREAAIRAIKGRFSMPVDNLLAEVIESMTAANVEPVRRGQLGIPYGDEYYGEFADCQECGADNMLPCNFCRNCGAKMNLEETK